jgi:hypothetical protein
MRRRPSAAVDATHAVTMVLLAWRPGRRRLALSNAAAATLLAACGIYYAQRERQTSGGG